MKRSMLLITAVLFGLSLLVVSLATTAVVADGGKIGGSEVSQGGGSFVMTKTVGLSASECASTKSIIVAPGQEVTYCYTVYNSSATTFAQHDLTDSELGVILNDFPFNLGQDGIAFLTQTAVIDAHTINTATWEASTIGLTTTVGYIDGAAVLANDLNTCRFPGINIPDNNITGTFTTMIVNPAGTILDLDVYIETTHTWVGDLKFALEHIDTGTTVDLIDRPGVPVATFGCSSNNMLAIIDDEASDAVETSCGASTLGLAGRYIGGDPANSSLMTAFDGEELNGQWQLHVSDLAGGDVGTLDSWCLLPTLAAAEVDVSPTSISQAQAPNTQTSHQFNIGNDGDLSLDWIVYESEETDTVQRQQTFTPMIPSAAPAQTFDAGLARDEVGNEVPATGFVGVNTAVTMVPTGAPPINVLFDNGPLVNMPGAGFGGADASVLQTLSLGMGTYGFAHQAQGGHTVADDFEVTDINGWYIDNITFFAYQTGSPLESTLTAVNYRIWDGPPNLPGSNIVIDPGMKNHLLDSIWSGIYRVSEADLTSTNRPIMQNTTSGGFVLPQGTYWLEWQTDGTLTSGPWVPSVTISGTTTTGNALQFFSGSWNSITDVGLQGLPFILSGYPLSGIPWATVSPSSGTNASGTDSDVTVTFDSSGLDTGVYSGMLFVSSNDPDQWVVPVAVTMSVGSEIYLPAVFNNYTSYFTGPEQEPNDTSAQANGPLEPGQAYTGFPDDDRDYFSFVTNSPGNINVALSNHTGQGGQLQLFYQSTANRVGFDAEPPFNITYSGQPGTYYVLIFTESGFNNTPYSLVVNTP